MNLKRKGRLCEKWLDPEVFAEESNLPENPMQIVRTNNSVYSKENLKWEELPVCQFCKKSHSKMARCKVKSEYLKSEEFLDRIAELYVEKELCLHDVADRICEEGPYCVNFVTIHKILKMRGLNRSVSEANDLDSSKTKREVTNLERTGFKHNFCAGCPSRDKWEARLYEEEGITNVFQRECVKEKIKKSILENYSVEYSGDLKIRGCKTTSCLNDQLENWLKSQDIDFFMEKKLDKKEGWYYSYDFCLEEYKLIIEVNGDYWHGNPFIYDVDDVIMKGSSAEIVVADKWLYDQQKAERAEELGYKVMVIWELDLKTDENKQYSRIMKHINNWMDFND